MQYALYSDLTRNLHCTVLVDDVHAGVQALTVLASAMLIHCITILCLAGLRITHSIKLECYIL
jgi:hypothetical protein